MRSFSERSWLLARCLVCKKSLCCCWWYFYRLAKLLQKVSGSGFDFHKHKNLSGQVLWCKWPTFHCNYCAKNLRDLLCFIIYLIYIIIDNSAWYEKAFGFSVNSSLVARFTLHSFCSGVDIAKEQTYNKNFLSEFMIYVRNKSRIIQGFIISKLTVSPTKRHFLDYPACYTFPGSLWRIV